MALSPPLRVLDASWRSMRTLSRTIFSGRRTNSSAVFCRSWASDGIFSDSQTATSPDGRYLGSVSSMSASIWAPDAPSMVAWWILVSCAIRPPESPSMT